MRKSSCGKMAKAAEVNLAAVLPLQSSSHTQAYKLNLLLACNRLNHSKSGESGADKQITFFHPVHICVAETDLKPGTEFTGKLISIRIHPGRINTS